ncbi:hypothetical protein ABZ628_24905 [Streptomyces diastaticus]|uniref:hypothetical protein n=1 Tax=Streptomyces diastaticus TaxID=1956 RepID=UPI0033CD8DAE
MASKNSIGCEIWSVDGDFFEQVLPVDRGAVDELLASTSPDDSGNMVWNDGEDPCLMIALSEGRGVVTLIIDAAFHTLVGSAEVGDVEMMVGGQSIVQPKRLTVSADEVARLIGELPDVEGMLRRYSWHRE